MPIYPWNYLKKKKNCFFNLQQELYLVAAAMLASMHYHTSLCRTYKNTNCKSWNKNLYGWFIVFFVISQFFFFYFSVSQKLSFYKLLYKYSCSWIFSFFTLNFSYRSSVKFQRRWHKFRMVCTLSYSSSEIHTQILSVCAVNVSNLF